MAHGTFDLFHPGHVAYLEYAARQGDRLIVMITDDKDVKRRKGSARPIQAYRDRKRVVEALRCVDKCVQTLGVSKDTGVCLMETLKKYRPDVFVSSYAEFKDNFGSELRRFGIKFVAVPYFGGGTTTGMIDRIVERYGKTAA